MPESDFSAQNVQSDSIRGAVNRALHDHGELSDDAVIDIIRSELDHGEISPQEQELPHDPVQVQNLVYAVQVVALEAASGD